MVRQLIRRTVSIKPKPPIITVIKQHLPKIIGAVLIVSALTYKPKIPEGKDLPKRREK